MIGMLLGINQSFRINDIKLHIAQTLLAGCDKNVRHSVQVSVTKQLGIYFDDG